METEKKQKIIGKSGQAYFDAVEAVLNKNGALDAIFAAQDADFDQEIADATPKKKDKVEESTSE
jgi:hypothetical protein